MTTLQDLVTSPALAGELRRAKFPQTTAHYWHYDNEKDVRWLSLGSTILTDEDYESVID